MQENETFQTLKNKLNHWKLNPKKMKNSFSLLTFLLLFYGSLQVQAQDTAALIPKATMPCVIDGVLGEEWKDATKFLIKGLTDPETEVFVKYDAEYLYIAFQNLITNENMRYNPEVLINTNINNTEWNENSFWFHSSYSNCWAVGGYYIWEDCSMNPAGWEANTLPFKNENNNIEFKISFSKLKMTPIKGEQLKVAFKLSNALEQKLYWPESATISDPSTWGVLKF